MTKVLLVEDDPRIRQALSLAMADESFEVIEASTGELAIKTIESGSRPDVVLLDLMLPGIDGIDVCHQIRAHSDLPIIMVTARSARDDLIAGLEAGADDYVCKPLDAQELTARIRALMRRTRTADSGPGLDPYGVLVLGDLRVIPALNEVSVAGQSVGLTRTEFRLLCELLTAHGTVVSREELLQRVWEYDYFGDTRLLDVHVRRLRRKVETDPGQPEKILTVRGVGYRAGFPTGG